MTRDEMPLPWRPGPGLLQGQAKGLVMTIKVDRLKREFCEVARALIDGRRKEQEPDPKKRDFGPALDALQWLAGLRDRVEKAKEKIEAAKLAYNEVDAHDADLEALDELWRKITSVSPVLYQTGKDSKDQGDRLESLFKSDCGGNERPIPEPAGAPALVVREAEDVPESSPGNVGESALTVGAGAEGAPGNKPVINVPTALYVGKAPQAACEALRTEGYADEVIAFILVQRLGRAKDETGKLLETAPISADKIKKHREKDPKTYRAATNKLLEKAKNYEILSD